MSPSLGMKAWLAWHGEDGRAVARARSPRHGVFSPSGARAHGRETIEGFLVHLPVRHEFDARIIFDQIVERLAGLRFQMLQQIFRLSYILERRNLISGAPTAASKIGPKLTA